MVDFLVARYGEFILLTPPFNAHTALLWAAPALLLLVGGTVAFGVFRKRRAKMAEVGGLSEDERAKLEEILSR